MLLLLVALTAVFTLGHQEPSGAGVGVQQIAGAEEGGEGGGGTWLGAGVGGGMGPGGGGGGGGQVTV